MPKRITRKRLLDLCVYNNADGLFRWRKDRGEHKKGTIAGWVDADGYCWVRLDRVLYPAHRLAWLYIFGSWPKTGLDHIDTNASNNIIGNLRLANKSENGANRGKNKNNTSGYKGVYWHRKGKCWTASITVKRKDIYLGLFSSVLEAAKAYDEAAIKLFGAYAKINIEVRDGT